MKARREDGRAGLGRRRCCSSPETERGGRTHPTAFKDSQICTLPTYLTAHARRSVANRGAPLLHRLKPSLPPGTFSPRLLSPCTQPSLFCVLSCEHVLCSLEAICLERAAGGKQACQWGRERDAQVTTGVSERVNTTARECERGTGSMGGSCQQPAACGLGGLKSGQKRAAAVPKSRAPNGRRLQESRSLHLLPPRRQVSCVSQPVHQGTHLLALQSGSSSVGRRRSRVVGASGKGSADREGSMNLQLSRQRWPTAAPSSHSQQRYPSNHNHSAPAACCSQAGPTRWHQGRRGCGSAAP